MKLDNYKDTMAKGQDAFKAKEYRKAYEYFNAGLEEIKELKDHDDVKNHYYVTQECVFDCLEMMHDYKNGVERIDALISEEHAKGEDESLGHLTRFMQRKAAFEIKYGNKRSGVNICGDVYNMQNKIKENFDAKVAVHVWNEHQRGTSISARLLEYWQEHFNYWMAHRKLDI